VPTVKDNNNMVQQEVGVHIPSFVVFLQPPLYVFEPIHVLIEIF